MQPSYIIESRALLPFLSKLTFSHMLFLTNPDLTITLPIYQSNKEETNFGNIHIWPNYQNKLFLSKIANKEKCDLEFWTQPKNNRGESLKFREIEGHECKKTKRISASQHTKKPIWVCQTLYHQFIRDKLKNWMPL